MVINFHKNFYKNYGKLPKKTQDKFWIKLEIFKNNQSDTQLNKHRLKGKFAGFYSINITGDIRAIYEKTGPRSVLFIKVGSHSQLYE